MADVDTDGTLDILATGFSANAVSVRLGNGNGRFSGTTTVSVGRTPYTLAVGDVNGDGKLDLVTANTGTDVNTASVRLGDGTGQFSGSTEVGVDTGPYDVVLADVNADGKLDLVTANTNGTASVRLGDGLGGFSGTTEVGVNSGAYALALGDLDGDGDLDLVTANLNGTASVRLGDGFGGFSGTTTVRVGTEARGVMLGDVNNDGKLDLVTADGTGSSSVSVCLGDGAGGFAVGTTVNVGRGPQSVALGDLDGDGDLDLVTANLRDIAISVRLNNGTGQAIPLPVQLTQFTARRTSARQVQLRWTTAQELQNAGFRVEKSFNGRAWQPLGFVPGHGTATAPNSYAYHDAEAGAAYYRLVQQDNDGTQTHSPVQFVAGGPAPALQLYPNPARATAQLLGAPAGAEVQLLNLQGQVLRRYPAGTTQLELRGLVTGLYLVHAGASVVRLVVE
ncbi:T9SS type A sorting domain-containing protein [Hymenobacter perfusus]|uniref:T9SS type A sorting domain-containing protein n=1 Tax=Hymenobacter perfusus TaxID=1236770 RepID=UPI0014772C41|nr:T9SS type A sorting domain-containing protein [Hymenobacter perfusus]